MPTASGAAIYGSGLPSDIGRQPWTARNTSNETFPKHDGSVVMPVSRAAAGGTFGDHHPAHGRNCAENHPDRSPTTTITLAPPPPAPPLRLHAAAVTSALS